MKVIFSISISCLFLFCCSKDIYITIPVDYYTVPLNMVKEASRFSEGVDEYKITSGQHIHYESRYVIHHWYSQLPYHSSFTNFYCEVIFQRMDIREIFNGKKELVQVNYAIYIEPDSHKKALYISWYNYDTTLKKISEQIAYTGNEWGIGKNTVVVETNLTKEQLQFLYPDYRGKVNTLKPSSITIDFTKRKNDVPEKVFWDSIVISKDSTKNFESALKQER